MHLTGVIYKKENGWVVFLNSDKFRFQEHYGDIINTKDSMLAKTFGKRNYAFMVRQMLLGVGEEHDFKFTNKKISWEAKQ